MQNNNKYFKANKENWNKRAKIHYDSDFYDVKGFLDSKNSLNEIEKKELGEVKGKSILHLQCHFGQDTLSLANLGAQLTGIDLSDVAIEKANELSKKTGIDAQFLPSNIYDLKNKLDSKFDLVYTSYGTIGWLPDIYKWAEIVSFFLNPGGEFFIVEFHPFIWMFDNNFERIEYSYFHSEAPFEEKVEYTYTNNDKQLNMMQYSWNHSLSDVINALIKNGLNIDAVKEYNYSPYNCFPNMIEMEKGKYIFKQHEAKIPILYSIKAKKT